jgi:hypothetical protein
MRSMTTIRWPRGAADEAREVILLALAKRLTWVQAAEILGISEMRVRRWHSGYGKYATTGSSTAGAGAQTRGGCRRGDRGGTLI